MKDLVHDLCDFLLALKVYDYLSFQFIALKFNSLQKVITAYVVL